MEEKIESTEKDKKTNEISSEIDTRRKLVLMGSKGVGKTSITSIIFNDLSPNETYLLNLTDSISTSRMRLPGGGTLKLLDCGGQDEYINEYFSKKLKEVFDDVSIFIFVIEAESVKSRIKENSKYSDINYFKNCISHLEERSPNAKVFVLIHKMDMIAEIRKKTVIEKKKHEILKEASDFQVTCFPTSIWDDSLYLAWRNIMSSTILNLDKLKKGLGLLMKACSAQEVILFDKSTFLSICSVCEKSNKEGVNEEDNTNFDRISKTIKKLNRALGKQRLLHLKLNTKNSTVYIEDFTRNTYILMSIKGAKINFEIIAVNIELTRNKFENITNPNY